MADKFEWIRQLGTASKGAQLDLKGVYYTNRSLSEKKQETADRVLATRAASIATQKAKRWLKTKESIANNPYFQQLNPKLKHKLSPKKPKSKCRSKRKKPEPKAPTPNAKARSPKKQKVCDVKTTAKAEHKTCSWCQHMVCQFQPEPKL